jgi:hypothetical protein
LWGARFQSEFYAPNRLQGISLDQWTTFWITKYKFQSVKDHEFVIVALNSGTDMLNETLYKKCSQKMKGGSTQKLIQYLAFKGTSIQGKNRLCVIFKSDSHQQQTLYTDKTLFVSPDAAPLCSARHKVPTRR